MYRHRSPEATRRQDSDSLLPASVRGYDILRRDLYCLAVLLIGTATAVPLQALAAQHTAVRPKQTKSPHEPAEASSKTEPHLEKPIGTDDKEKSAQRLQQTHARKLQEAELKAQQAQARHAEESQRLQQEQARQSQEVARLQQAKARDAEEAERVKKEALRKAHLREMQELQAAGDVEKYAEKQAVDKPEEEKSDEAEVAFRRAHAEILSSAFSGPRKVKDRESLPPIALKMVSVQKAVNSPFVIRNADGEQRHQVQIFQQNLANRLLGLPATQTPSNYAETRKSAIDIYFNNYPAYVNHQPITVTRKNTYIREVAPLQYPTWYERKPGWTYANAYVLGSAVQVNSDWFGWEWPAVFGAPPAGFLCQPDYFPTPWIYVTYNDHWRQAGENAYKAGPDSDYTGPITVETVEPITAKFPDKFGVPVFQTINVLYFYNAFYQPEFQRWGYLNKQGNFVWLNI